MLFRSLCVCSLSMERGHLAGGGLSLSLCVCSLSMERGHLAGGGLSLSLCVCSLQCVKFNHTSTHLNAEHADVGVLTNRSKQPGEAGSG